MTLYSQNQAFMLIINQDTAVINRKDTVCTLNSGKRKVYYDNETFKIMRLDSSTTIIFTFKIADYQKDSLSKLPIAMLAEDIRQTTVDNESKKVVLEGSFVKGKQVGVWHDRTTEFDKISVYDSTGTYLSLVKYEIDTSDQLIYIYKIDTLSFDYKLTTKINLIVNPFNYFKTASREFDSEDTLRFCLLNQHMDTLGYKSWKTQDGDFIRFIWFREKKPINLEIEGNDSGLTYNLVVTDAEYDLNLGNFMQQDSTRIKEPKDFYYIKKELDKMVFWSQISKDGCFGDYLFVEAKIGNKYNSKRINCMEYRLPENRDLMKLFKKSAKKAGLEDDYKVIY